MQVFIVMVESIYSSHTQWDIDRTFSTRQAAEEYIKLRKLDYARSRLAYDMPEFDIEVEEVYE
jgi:hypothetical protein